MKKLGSQFARSTLLGFCVLTAGCGGAPKRDFEQGAISPEGNVQIIVSGVGMS